MPIDNHNPACPCLTSVAERELGAFISSVTELYGPEEGRISAEEWLDELESLDRIPESTTRHWRMITIAAAARLSTRLIEAGHCATRMQEKIASMLEPRTTAPTACALTPSLGGADPS